MKRHDRLKPVSRIAGSKEEAAARKMAASNDRVARQEQRLTQLEGYLAEYNLGRENGRTVLNAGQLRIHQGFVDTLYKACVGEKIKLNSAVAEHAKMREEWLDAHRRNKALETFIDKSLREERIKSDKHEQKDADALMVLNHPGVRKS
jgi:flagellar FliJ protein